MALRTLVDGHRLRRRTVVVLFVAKANEGIYQQNKGLSLPVATTDRDLGDFGDGSGRSQAALHVVTVGITSLMCR